MHGARKRRLSNEIFVSSEVTKQHLYQISPNRSQKGRELRETNICQQMPELSLILNIKSVILNLK